jgi:tRNA(Ile)-lysidine synthase
MKEKVLETIKKYNLIESGDKIVIGVSGGPDSIALLSVLLEIKKDKVIDFEITKKVFNFVRCTIMSRDRLTI